jgi:hypothetical protein
VDVLVAITLDEFPVDTGYQIRDNDGDIVFEIATGTYASANAGAIVTEVVSLNRGADFVFVLKDSYTDGFSGEVVIYLGASQDSSSVLAYYGPSLGVFTDQYEIPFGVGDDFIIDIFPTPVPREPSPFPSSEPSAPSMSPAPSSSDVTLLLIINLDSFPSETGYRIESTEDGEVVREVLPGSYGSNQDFGTIREEFQVSLDENYTLTLLDAFGDGLRSPVYLYLDYEANSQTLGKFDPDTDNSYFTEFIIPFRASAKGIIQVFPTPAPTGPTAAPSGAPSAPTVSNAPSSLDTEVLIEILTTSFGDEMGWIIETLDGEELYSVGSGNYSSYSEYNETVLLPQNQDFVFTIIDSYG